MDSVTKKTKCDQGNAKLHNFYIPVTLNVTFSRKFVLLYASHSYQECEFVTHLSYGDYR